MPANAITLFVFVDFENVPEVDLGPVDGKPVHVTLLIGKNQRRLDLALVRQIHRLAAQVELVEVGASGRNALDLTLACYLGLAVQRTPAARFCIVSKDRDFEPMIDHLSGKGIKVARYGDFHLLPFLAPAGKPAARPGKQPEDRRVRVIARLRNPASRNRPSSRKALLAHIKASLGKEASDAGAGDILRELCEKNVLTIDSRDKVSYLTWDEPILQSRLTALEMTPDGDVPGANGMARFELADHWLQETLDRECAPFGCEVAEEATGSLSLQVRQA